MVEQPPVSPQLNPEVIHVFTESNQGRLLAHPDMHHHFVSFRFLRVKERLRELELHDSLGQAHYLYNLGLGLPYTNQKWVKAGVQVIPDLACFDSAYGDIFRAVTELPSNAAQFLCHKLAAFYGPGNHDGQVRFLPEGILQVAFGYAASAKDVRQALPVATFAGNEMMPETLIETLASTAYIPTFVRTRVWSALLQIAACRGDEITEDGATVRRHLATNPRIIATTEKTVSTGIMRLLSRSNLRDDWVQDYQSTS